MALGYFSPRYFSRAWWRTAGARGGTLLLALHGTGGAVISAAQAAFIDYVRFARRQIRR